MSSDTFKHFKYELALGNAIPMPKPPIDYYPHDQFTVQQFLVALCKTNVGSLGKRGGKWEFGEDAPSTARLSSRPDITEIFDFAEKLGIIEQQSGDAEGASGAFIPYKLSEAYWDKFEKYTS